MGRNQKRNEKITFFFCGAAKPPLLGLILNMY
jgi:hypothetical protein